LKNEGRLWEYNMTAIAIDESTQDSVWYNCLPIMKRMNVKVTREHFKKVIKTVCDKLGVTREQLGIVAAPWATMYYKGNWMGVSFDAINSLAERGTDIIFIEKLDIVKVLGKYADKYGVALVNSRGHLSDYAKDLADAGINSGAHIAIMTDYDIPGIIIASGVTGIPWIGVNENMLTYFGLSKQNENIVVPYTPAKKAISDQNLDTLLDDERFQDVDITFLKHNKIELDAILASVGSERLWEYLMNKLTELYPERDYTRVIDSKPPLENHHPKAIRNFNLYISKHVDSLVREEVLRIESELENVEGFIDVKEKEDEIDKRLGEFVENDQHLKDIASTIKEAAKKAGYDINQIEGEGKVGGSEFSDDNNT
jgi:hypothetical protein